MKRVGTVLLGIIESHPLLHIRPRRRELPQEEKVHPRHAARLQEDLRVLEALRQGEKLFRHLPRRLPLRPV